jgi:hypothetical protein
MRFVVAISCRVGSPRAGAAPGRLDVGRFHTPGSRDLIAEAHGVRVQWHFACTVELSTFPKAIMIRGKCVVWIALFACAPACSSGPGDDVDLGQVDPGSSWPKSPKVPKDAAPPDTAPPDTALPPPPADGGGGSTAGFIDACLLPGMTRATFNATGTFDAIDEGVTAALSLPFPFTFYGNSQSTYWITTNGQLGFGATPGGSPFGQVTCPLPDARFTTPIVLVYSADLIGRYDPDAGVCYAITGTAPSRKLVVTWKDSFFYDAWLASNLTFSAMLHEGTNAIDVVIDRAAAPYQPDYETGAAAALGKQSGASGAAFSCFQPHAPAGTAIHYNP